MFLTIVEVAMKSGIKGILFGAGLLSAAGAQAELSAMSEAQLRGIEGQGYLLTVGRVAEFTVPTLAEGDLVVGPIAVSQLAAQAEQRYPRIDDARSLVVQGLNRGPLAAVNNNLQQDPVLRIFAPVLITLTPAP